MPPAWTSTIETLHTIPQFVRTAKNEMNKKCTKLGVYQLIGGKKLHLQATGHVAN